MNRTLWITIGAALVCFLVCALGGFVVGRNVSASKEEASIVAAEARSNARLVAFRTAKAESRKLARERSERRATKIGTSRGRSAGRKAGEAEVASQQAAAEAAKPQTGYFGGCSEPLFVNGYCPTPSEIEAERNIEAYCGPGMKLPDGRIVPKPGC